ncbi:hypothetical protein [Propylenella binzhouense]|uniref:Peptidase M15 n=1 Tax=Propylenella binzhouense TaxID=2555902 RepID=A0A964WSR5_9HYPH|nr:hypothetical protein [Propylenella binzhouense]MYZ47075.1 hypothetical protein [Propylenella binzhouense]
MRRPGSVRGLEELGRVRLSRSFFLRDFLHSEVASLYGLPNVPDDPDRAIAAGRRLCEDLLEPLADAFGRISIRSGYRSAEVNRVCNARGHNCARNEADRARHIWDAPDAEGRTGAMATVIVNAFIPYYERTGDWEAIAWWIDDHLPYSELQVFPRYAAFNIGWREVPKRSIYSYVPPRRGWLRRPGTAAGGGPHPERYADFLTEFVRNK